ncbi:hypothetical protein ACLOJK_040271 [Asimina triloba]
MVDVASQEMKFGWKIIVGSVIGFFGAAFGSVGGVGGGGIFVPMLTLIIGFDAKSSTAISKFWILVANTPYGFRIWLLRVKVDEYVGVMRALCLLEQYWSCIQCHFCRLDGHRSADNPFPGAFMKGVETWKKETTLKKEAAKLAESQGETEEYEPLPGGSEKSTVAANEPKVSILDNVYWKELSLLVFVWVAFLALQIAKMFILAGAESYNHLLDSILGFELNAGILTFSNLGIVPVSLGVSLYEAVCLYKGTKVIESEEGIEWKVHQLVLYCSCGILAGIVGGLLGLGGGFILGPLFLELGIPPQSNPSLFQITMVGTGKTPIAFVSSATATFAMTFSSSMSVVEYYLLNRFPVPYALYFVAVATVAALVGQHAVRKLIVLLGRASLIIFILAFTIFVSAISLVKTFYGISLQSSYASLTGGVGISNMVWKIARKEYMGFENLCSYEA